MWGQRALAWFFCCGSPAFFAVSSPVFLTHLSKTGWLSSSFAGALFYWCAGVFCTRTVLGSPVVVWCDTVSGIEILWCSALLFVGVFCICICIRIAFLIPWRMHSGVLLGILRRLWIMWLFTAFILRTHAHCSYSPDKVKFVVWGRTVSMVGKALPVAGVWGGPYQEAEVNAGAQLTLCLWCSSLFRQVDGATSTHSGSFHLS